MEILSPFFIRLNPLETFNIPINIDKIYLLKLNKKLTKNGIIALNYLLEPGDTIQIKNINVPTQLFTGQRSPFGDNWTVSIQSGDTIGKLFEFKHE